MTEQLTDRQKEAKLATLVDRAYAVHAAMQILAEDMDYLWNELSELLNQMRTVEDEEARRAAIKQACRDAFDECRRRDKNFLKGIISLSLIHI